MKKRIFLSILMMALLLRGATCFATEAAVGNKAEEASDKTLAALESSKSNAATEAQKADKDVFQESDFFNGTKAKPVATVSGGESSHDIVFTEKSRKVEEKAAASKPLLEKKISEVKTKSESSFSTSNSAETQKRWKALFSKEAASDSIIYTVKPGDSLYVLARKNHTTVDFIKKINGLKGDSIYPGMKLKIHTAPFSIFIDKSKNTLILYSNDVPVKKYSVATGKKNCTPIGEFKITEKLLNPTWFKTGAVLPPGSPENALGTRWMGFDKPAYGIHGTIEPKSIGTQASEGCVRMLNEDVEELYSIVPSGTKVTIQD